MPRAPIPSLFFVLVVVRQGDRFLLVQERKHGQLWYLPAGRVEPGEDFVSAARRETHEEAGIDIKVTGLIRIEHLPSPTSMRVRLILAAEQVGHAPPKSVPDDESLRAGWFTLEEMRHMPLRGEEMLDLFEHVKAGALMAPVEFIAFEGAPYPARRQTPSRGV